MIPVRNQVIAKVEEKKIIAIVRGLDADHCIKLAEALHAGGIDMIEITFQQDKPETFSETASSIQAIAEHFHGEVIPGAGTVITLEQLDIAAKAGAQYIISPNVDTEIIKKTRELGLVSMPGALTPTDIIEAHKAGADFVKVFPIGSLGVGYLKAIKAPITHIKLLAVGGVNEKNAMEFMKAGAVGIGVGGNIVNKDWIAAGEFDKITALAKEYVAAVKG